MMIKDSLRRLPGLLAGVLLLAGTAACTIEPLVSPDMTGPGSGDRVALRLELGVSSSELGIRTRTATAGEELSDAFSSDAVTSLWVGVFDVETGNLVGKNNFRFDAKGGKGTATVDILYYDAHPVLRIFGVANYEGITGHKGEAPVIGNPFWLSQMLDDVKTMSDLFEISVDAESANQAALSTGAPLMMGVYAESDADEFYTIKAIVDKDDKNNYFVKAYDSAYGNADLTLNDASVEHMYDRLDYAKLDGSIRLRRLLSQVNVKVEGGTGITVSNLSYRKFNMPTEVYLQERKMTGMNGTFNEWKLVTPNRADALVQPGGNKGNVSGIPYYKRDEEFTKVENGTSFQFHQYENKHWGNDGYQSARETTRTMTDFQGNPVFAALCGDNESGTIYNNYASYFELKMDVEDEKNNQRGTVTYRIHEGYCNNENGIADPKNGRDFSCFRNTIYNYTITVNGLNSIDVTADAHNHNSGVVGGVLLVNGDKEGDGVEVRKENESVVFSGKLVDYVCYYENDGAPVIYGNNEDSELLSIPALASTNAKWMDPSAAMDFGFKLDATDVRNLFKDDDELNLTDAKVTVIDATQGKDGHFSPKKHVHALYLLVDESKEGDPCKNYKYYRYYYFPEDSRKVITSDPNFKLAFANTWDNESSEDNGAVADNIKAIKFSMTNARIPADAAPEYKVYVDGNLVYTGNELETIDLWSLCDDELKKKFTAQSKHKVNVVIRDESENYQDYDSDDIQFVVYPTIFKWDYAKWDGDKPTPGGDEADGEVPANSYFFSGNAHITDTDIYAGIKHVRDMKVGQGTNGPIYLQTGGSDSERHLIQITALYDAILTIYPSATGNKWEYNRYLKVVDSKGIAESVYAAIPSGNPSKNDNTPYHFYVKKGCVDIYSLRSFNIYSMELTYLNSPEAPGDRIWNFADSKWEEITRQSYNATTNKYDIDLINFSRFVDGLHLESGDNNATLRTGENFIDLRGKGSVEEMKRVFWFDAYKSGTVKVYAGSGKQSENRNMVVEYGGKQYPLHETNSTECPINPEECEITVTEQPTRVYIYSGNSGMFVYRIDYIEKK